MKKTIFRTHKTGVPYIFGGSFVLGIFTVLELIMSMGWLWIIPSLVTIFGFVLSAKYQIKIEKIEENGNLS